MAAWLATQKVRHLATWISGRDSLIVGHWQALCSDSAHPAGDAIHLWAQDSLHLLADGNRRRSMAARWRHPVCTRCRAEYAAMGDLLTAELTGELAGDLALFTGRPRAEVTTALATALTGPARPLSTSGPDPL